MIEFKSVQVRREGRVLFSDASFQLHPMQKVGLTGNNGTGKSTLFAVLLAELGVDAGEVTMPSTWQLAHMAQEVAASTQSALDYVLMGDAEWYRLNDQLANPERLSDDALIQAQARFEDIDGYRTRAKAAQILSGLGFVDAQHDAAVASFSGGWRMRLNLAKTLMSRADVLLLDEPTNHLDLDAILWLEDWLAQFAGLVLLISHDQHFLDAVVGHILHIEQQQVTLYTGNYSQFVRIRSERLAQAQQAYDKQQATKAHLEDYIRRFRAKASKAKQAQSRIKQLERMSELAPIMADNQFSFRFYPPSQMSSPLITLTQADIGYEQIPLLIQVSLQVTPETRLGLLGMNGAGKSTLIKALVGELPLMAGSYRSYEGLKLGYFSQHQMDSLDADASPMLMLRRLAGTTSDAELRAFLGSFDFRGERIDTPSHLFSGGERARLTLALIVWQRPNVLVLDEPTNHLDLQMRQALTLALQDFGGAVVLVSHDRELIANVCDELYLVHAGSVTEFTGDIQDYGKWLKEARKQTSIETKANAPSTTDRKTDSEVSRETSASGFVVTNQTDDQNEVRNSQPRLSKEEQRKLAAEQRKLTAPLRKQIEQAEATLEAKNEALTAVEIRLADTELYEEAQKAELLELLAGQSQLQHSIAELEEQLLDWMDELERMQWAFEVPSG